VLSLVKPLVQLFQIKLNTTKNNLSALLFSKK
jgi:hypothetical protein